VSFPIDVHVLGGMFIPLFLLKAMIPEAFDGTTRPSTSHRDSKLQSTIKTTKGVLLQMGTIQ